MKQAIGSEGWIQPFVTNSPTTSLTYYIYNVIKMKTCTYSFKTLCVELTYVYVDVEKDCFKVTYFTFVSMRSITDCSYFLPVFDFILYLTTAFFPIKF